jgi:hypothetical protein
VVEGGESGRDVPPWADGGIVVDGRVPSGRPRCPWVAGDAVAGGPAEGGTELGVAGDPVRAGAVAAGVVVVEATRVERVCVTRRSADTGVGSRVTGVGCGSSDTHV